MRSSHHNGSSRGLAGLALAALATLPGLAACSSSSSGGALSPADASASAAASAAYARLGITPIPNLAPGAHGPNGDIAAPASNAPNKTSPGGSEVFPNITGGTQLDKLRNHLTKFHGVQTVTYYPQFNQLQVYFAATATSANRDRVYRYVVKHYPAAAGSPTASPTASPTTTVSPTTSPTPSASATS